MRIGQAQGQNDHKRNNREPGIGAQPPRWAGCIRSAGLVFLSFAWVISKEDLILSKLVWAAPSGSAFQLRDVRKLLASGVDEAYLRQWSVRLGVDALLLKCRDAGYDF